MSKKPDFIIYNVVSRKDKDDHWKKIGGGFEFFTEDGRQGVSYPDMKLVIIRSQPADTPSQR